MSEINAVGIDLGTTYSSLAVVNKYGVPEVVPNAENERLTPSVVLFDEDAIIVGQVARDAILTSPDRVVMFVKRQMGTPYWYFQFEGQRYSATDISAIILRKLKLDAEKRLNRSLQYAVITVPAYFDDDRRRATKSAGEQAGFKVLGLLNEPTAAAIAFGIDRCNRPETVLVYDLGGGTFDVTIMRVEGKEIRILATDGDHQLGGKDFDDAIMALAVRTFCQEHGSGSEDPTLDPLVAGELRVQAEKAKRELSKRNKTYFVFRAHGKASRIEITREQFTELIKPKLITTISIVQSTLRAAGLQPRDIDRILLIGGSTRIPAVATMLEEFFEKVPDTSVNPDEAVAYGAALRAAHIAATEIAPDEVPEPVLEKVGGLQITDVTSHSIGIEASVPGTDRRINSIIIPRNSPIPTEVAKEFVTTLPGQTAIKVTILQGEFQEAAACKPIGEFILRGLPPGRPPGCKVRVTIGCTADGVVRVTALDIQTGQQTQTEVSYRSEIEATQALDPRQRWKSEKPIL